MEDKKLFTGATPCLKLAIGSWDPFIKITNFTAPYEIEGAAVDILKIILSKLQLCYEYIMPSDSFYGQQLENGSWTGNVGLLHRREADMSGVVFMVSEGRTPAIDFSEFIYMSDQTIAYERPELESDMLGFIKPYTYGMWLSIFLSFLVVLVISLLIQKGYIQVSLLRSQQTLNVNRSENEKQISSSDDASEADAYNVTIWTFNAILTQSVPWEPKADSMRIIAGIWLIMAFVLATVYRSNLVAMLVAPSLKLPFDSFEDLAKTDFKVLYVEYTVIDQAINDAQPGSILYPTKKNFYKGDYDDAVNGFYAGKGGLISTRSTLDFGLRNYYSINGKCGHYIMSTGILKTTLTSYAFPKKSPLKAKVDHIIRNLREFGITDHILRSKLWNGSECYDPIGIGVSSENKPLDMEDLLSSFLILLAGLFLSAAVFLAEIIAAKR